MIFSSILTVIVNALTQVMFLGAPCNKTDNYTLNTRIKSLKEKFEVQNKCEVHGNVVEQIFLPCTKMDIKTIKFENKTRTARKIPLVNILYQIFELFSL